MAATSLNSRIQQPVYTAAALAAANPVLLNREVVYESDTGKLKIGDGVLAWNDLPHFGDGGEPQIGEIRDSTAGNIFGDKYMLCDGSILMAVDYPKAILERIYVTATSITGTRKDVVYGNNIFVAIGDYISVSHDGISWTAGGVAPVAGLTSVTFGGGLFVAVGSGGDEVGLIATSPDGMSWTQRSSAGSRWLDQVIYCGERWFVAGGNPDSIISSEDGITWTKQPVPISYPRAITYGNGVFIMPEGNGGKKIAISTDGLTWTTATLPNGLENNSPSCIAFGNGMFVLPATGSKVAYSNDGVGWIDVQLPTLNGQKLNYISFVNDLFIASSAYYAHTSKDGINWTSCYVDKRQSITLKNVIFDGNKFIGAATNGITSYLIYSIDGGVWSSIPNVGCNSFTGQIAYGSGMLVGCFDGKVMRSNQIRLPSIALSGQSPITSYIKMLE